MGRLREKLLETLESGTRLFVIQRREAALHGEEIATLAKLLRNYGPNTLLVVTLADPGHPPGSLERLDPGLLRGYVDRFSPSNDAEDASFDAWRIVCEQAYDEWQAHPKGLRAAWREIKPGAS